MIALWLQAGLVFGLALAAWISGLDANGTAIESALLWTASALTAASLLFRRAASGR
jgi:hypothetical protein